MKAVRIAQKGDVRLMVQDGIYFLECWSSEEGDYLELCEETETGRVKPLTFTDIDLAKAELLKQSKS